MKVEQVHSAVELWNIKQVKMATGLSERTLWRLNEEAKIPATVRIGRSVRWRRSDIMLWIELGCPSRRKFDTQKLGKEASVC